MVIRDYILKTPHKPEVLINNVMTKVELAEELGISRPTLNSRLSSKTNWKKLETKHINKLYDEI